MKQLYLISMATAVLSVAGCTSSSTGVAGSSTEGSGSSSAYFLERYGSVAGLAAAGDAGTLVDASEEMMTGTATLTGVLGIGDVNDADEAYGEVLADLTMNADFTNGTVTANAENFAQYSQDDLDNPEIMNGMVAMTGSISGAALTANGSGVLTNDDGSLNLALDLDGKFVDYEGTLGAYGETIATVDGENEFEGGFAVIKQ